MNLIYWFELALIIVHLIGVLIDLYVTLPKTYKFFKNLYAKYSNFDFLISRIRR